MEFSDLSSIIKQVNTVFFFVFFMTVFFMTYFGKNTKEIENMKYSIFDDQELRSIKNELK
ncbi:MAG: hypothetical protein AABZ74_11435 [Cyanobacteriota bacterium]